MRKIIVKCTEFVPAYGNRMVDVNSLLYHEDGTPVEYEGRHLGQISSNFAWAMSDITINNQERLEKLFPEGYELDFQLITLAQLREQEIIIGNKLIAAFMGKKPKDPVLMFKENGIATPYFEDMEKYEKLGYVANFYYHSSWEKIMPVWVNIGRHYPTTLTESSASITSNALSPVKGCDIFNKGVGIELIFQTVVDFIKWLNENIKNG